MTMMRTTVYLSLDAKRRLSAAAQRQHRSEAELIRDAISRLLAEEPESPRPNPPRFDLDPSVADHVDEHLSAGFGDQRHFRVITPLSRKFDAFRLLPADL